MKVACGVCHMDWQTMRGEFDGNPLLSGVPIILGHEGVGEVVQIGDNVSNISPGDRIGIPWLHSSCSSCEFCLSGCENLCTQQIRTGFSSQGCFAEFVTIPASFAILIPHSLNIYEAAPLLCAGLTSYKAVKESKSKPGDFIGITGASGGVGHLAIQYAKAMGLIVCAFTHTGEKMRFCEELGADFVFDLNSSDALSDAITQTGGGCHAIINISPSADSTRFCIDVLRPRGTMIQVGLPSGSFDIPIFPVVIKGLTIKGSVAGTREDMIEAFGFADRGLIKPIISVHNFDHVMDVFSQFQDGKFGSMKGRQVFKIGNPSLQSDYLSYPIVPQ